MPLLLDTDIAIHLRDGYLPIVARVSQIADDVAMSVVTLVELMAELAVGGRLAEHRKAGIADLLNLYELLDLDRRVTEVYGSLIESLGFSRTRVFDRLIAATALVHDLTLVTINGADFRDIPDLKLDVWTLPAQ